MADLTPARLNELRTKFEEALSEYDARVFERGDTKYTSLTDDAEVWRTWNELSPDDIPEIIDYLNAVTSVKNLTAKRYVDDPMVSGEVISGRWRQAFIRRIPQGDVTKLVQVLRRGYAAKLLDDEVRLVEGDNEPFQPERKLVRRYANLDYQKIGVMIDDLLTTKYITNPVIDDKVYEGRYRLLSSKPARVDDGSGIITQILAKNLVISGDSLPTPVLLSDEKALLSPFAHDTASVKNAYVWEYRWVDPSYAQTLRDTIALTSDVIDAKVLKVDDGTCNIQVLTQANTWKGTLSQKWEHQTQFPTFAANSVVDTYSHIPLTSLDTFKTTLGTATSGYKVSSLVDSTNAEGGFATIVQTQDKLFVGTVSADNGVNTEAEYLPLLTGGVFRTTTWIGVPDDDLATAMTTLATPPSDYFIRNLVNNYNGTGSCTIVRTMGPAGPYDVTAQANQFPGFDDERRTYWYAGLTATEATAKYTELKTTCDEGYKVDSVEVREYRWETVLVIQNISKLNLILTGTVQNTDYTKTFGLVNIASTLYLNVAYDSLAGLKASILADATKLILRLYDDDAGQGKANIVCVWRSKEDDPTGLGAIRSSRPSAFHQTTQERTWININLTSKDALSDAVALAMAGTSPYTKDSTKDVIIGATGDDAGDKTGIVRQTVVKKPGFYTYADYSLLDSFNPHGLKEATMVTSVREYPEVAYDDLSTVYTELVTFLGEPIAKGKVQTSLNGNGTFAIRAFKEGKPDWDNTTPVYNKTNVRNPGVNGQQETFQATGVPVANAPAIVAGAAASSSDYQLDNAQFIERDHGEGVVQATQTKKNESAVIVRNFPARGSQRAIDERIWPLIRQEDFTTIWGEAIGVTETLALGTRVTDAGYPNNILDYAQADLLGNGMWRISSLVVKCPETILIADGTEIACNDDSDVTLYQVQDATDIPTFSSASPTSVRLTSLEKNRYGKYDYVKQTTTSRVPKSCSIAISWTTKGRYYWIVHTYLEGVPLTWWRYYDPTVHTISFHTTGDAAKTALSGGNNGSVPHRVGNNLWMAHKVVWGNPVHE